MKNNKNYICFLPCPLNDVLITDNLIDLVDPELIEKCRKGNLKDFRKVVESTSPFAFSVAFRILGNEELAKDIVQETMVTVWQKLQSKASSGSFRSWLCKIVINKCYDHLRKRKNRIEFRAYEETWALIEELTAADQYADLENKEIAGIISLLTNRLSPKQKTIFVLSDIEEMTREEISEITGISKRNIKANLYHARAKISEMISKYI